jgi:hypothetical protein
MELYHRPAYTSSYFRQSFESAIDYARSFIIPLSEYDLSQRPDPHTWNIAECYDHLTVTGNQYLNPVILKLNELYDKGPTGRGPYRNRFYVQWFIELLLPPFKLKFKAPGSFQPRRNMNKTEILEGFLGLQNEILIQLERATDLHLGKIKVAHPLVPFIKLSISEVLAIIDAHQVRHFWQAKQILYNIRNNESSLIR